MKRIIISIPLILLFATFSFADDPPSQTIGEYYTLSVYGGTGNSFSRTIIESGDDESHPCLGKLHAYSYQGTGIRDIIGYGKEVGSTLRFCIVRHQGTYTGWYRNETSSNVFFDSANSYALHIDIYNGSWGAEYQFNIHEPATGVGGN